jgi:hypothetical protein
VIAPLAGASGREAEIRAHFFRCNRDALVRWEVVTKTLGLFVYVREEKEVSTVFYSRSL